MAAGVARILAERFPSCRLDYWVPPPVHRALWAGVPGLPFTVREEPIRFATWREYDYHAVLEDMCENDLEPDQGCTWDHTLWALGLDPATVPECRKVPLVPLTATDRRDADQWRSRVDVPGPFILWQSGASTPIRSVSPGRTVVLLRELVAALPRGVRVLAVGSRDEETSYGGPITAGVPSVACAWGLPLRVTFALVEQAACVVAPDSCLGHAAGGLARPCVGLWSSFHPRDRVAYYPGHRPLYVDSPCGVGPCRMHEMDGMTPGCPRSTGPWCAGLESISPEAVVREVLDVIGATKE
jgi:hypothetical protein